MYHSRESSPRLTQLAAQTLNDPKANERELSLAGSVLSQTPPHLPEGFTVENRAIGVSAQAFFSPNFAENMMETFRLIR